MTWIWWRNQLVPTQTAVVHYAALSPIKPEFAVCQCQHLHPGPRAQGCRWVKEANVFLYSVPLCFNSCQVQLIPKAQEWSISVLWSILSNCVFFRKIQSVQNWTGENQQGSMLTEKNETRQRNSCSKDLTMRQKQELKIFTPVSDFPDQLLL